jgi:hypothetical protein
VLIMEECHELLMSFLSHQLELMSAMANACMFTSSPLDTTSHVTIHISSDSVVMCLTSFVLFSPRKLAVVFRCTENARSIVSGQRMSFVQQKNETFYTFVPAYSFDAVCLYASGPS